jgi:EAL domain-containing protein (putative c-di-GMP-specific phosphodiesterase class I)
MRRQGHAAASGAGLSAYVLISANQVAQETFAAQVAGLLAEYDMPPELLILTLKDTSRIPDVDRAGAVLWPLARRGIRTAVDEVGGGTNTFAVFRTIPLQIIRLDHHLTGSVDGQDGGRAAALRDVIVSCADRLGLSVTATGITDPAQARRLAAVGCHLGTGRLYGPFRPLADVPATAEHAYTAAGRSTAPW